MNVQFLTSKELNSVNNAYITVKIVVIILLVISVLMVKYFQMIKLNAEIVLKVVAAVLETHVIIVNLDTLINMILILYLEIG